MYIWMFFKFIPIQHTTKSSKMMMMMMMMISLNWQSCQNDVYSSLHWHSFKQNMIVIKVLFHKTIPKKTKGMFEKSELNYQFKMCWNTLNMFESCLFIWSNTQVLKLSMLIMNYSHSSSILDLELRIVIVLELW